MATIHDFDRGADLHHDSGTASVAAATTADLATVTVDAGDTVLLLAAGASFKGTSVLSQSRGFLLEARESSTVELARSAHGTNTPRPIEQVMYENTTGDAVTVAVVGFHGDSVSHDMSGYHTWMEI